MVEIGHYDSIDEIQVTARFLRWQGCETRYSFLNDYHLLEENGGKPGVKINFNGTIIWGFKNLIKFWEEKGLWLC